MVKRIFLLGILSVFSMTVCAQTERPGVLIIGNGKAAVAAGIQSAVSGVQTTLLIESGGFDLNPMDTAELSSGLQQQWIDRIRAKKFLPEQLDKQQANLLMQEWCDSTKNLKVLKNVQWIKGNRSGKNWVFKLSDGKTLRPKVLVTADNERILALLKNTQWPVGTWKTLTYENKEHRTSVAAGRISKGTEQTYLSLYDLFVPEEENIITLGDPESMLWGQAAGATAAYAAFFGKNTSESSLNAIQGELVHYGLELMPLRDVKGNSPLRRAIQMAALTSVLKASLTEQGALFNGMQGVKTEEIKEVLKEHFFKAQIWFEDYDLPEITFGGAIDLVCYVGNKSKEQTLKEVEKKWKTTYGFSSEMNPDRLLTRIEFAAILQDYLPPFNVRVDQKGKVIH